MPAVPLIRSVFWSTVYDIVRREAATTMCKSLNGLVPEYLSNLFEKYSTRNVRQLRNTDTDLSLPLRKTNNELRAISFCDLSFGINSNPMPNRHLSLPPLRKELNTNYDDHSYFVVST